MFLLHCPTNKGNKRRDAFGKIDPKVLAAAGERDLKKADYPGHRLNAIACLGFVDPRSAEQHLRRIYEDSDQAINDRARVFAELWKCEKPEASACGFSATFYSILGGHDGWIG